MTEYDHYRFKSEESTLVSVEYIDASRQHAIEHIEEYIRNADIYLGDLARHRKFVERNIEHDKLIEFNRKRVYRWWRTERTSAAHEYQIIVSDIPLLHDKPTLQWPVNKQVIYTANIPVRQTKTAFIRFLHELMRHEPRFISIDDVDVAKLAYYIHKLPEFQNTSVRNYRLLDVIDALHESVLQNHQKYKYIISFFDIDRI